MAEPFRLAFVGVDHPHGAGWRQLLPALAGEVELVGLVPGFQGATTSLEERYAHLPRADSVGELIQRVPCDGAIVCLSNREGPRALQELATAGKHILAEKPVAMSDPQFEPVATAVEAAGVTFQNGYLWRYDAGAERLRAMVAEGRFGRLIHLDLAWFTSDVARRGASHYLFDREESGRGFFNWLACHWLDLVLYVVDRPVVAVSARLGCHGATAVEVDDGGTAILELEGGTQVTVIGGYWLPRWANELRWEIRGSERWVRWEPAAPGSGGLFHIHGPQPQFLAMDETYVLPEDATPGYGGARSLRLIRDWIDSARSGAPRCRNTIASTRATLRLLDLIHQASDEGRRLETRIEPAPVPVGART